MIFGANLGKKTESAKQALLKYLWDRQLSAGDRIPAQPELCRLFGVGGATVNRAVQALVQDGVLEARRNVGVFVRDARPEGHPGRSVGLVGLINDRLHLFNWTLANSIQKQLQLNGCQCTNFPLREVYREGQPLSAFTGLETMLGQSALDGIICVTDFSLEECVRLEAQGIAVCFAGAPSPMKSGIFIDHRSFVTRALDDVREQGYRRPAVLVGPGPVRDTILAVLRERLPGWSDVADPAQAFFEGCSIETGGIEGGRQAAQTILALPPERRFDSVIICDDIMAQGFFSELMRLQDCRADYLPFAVCMRNRRFEIDYPCRGQVVYEVDIERIAAMTVAMLLDKLQNGVRPGAVEYYRPEIINR